VSFLLIGCSRSVPIVDQKNIEERNNFISLVNYMRSNKEVNEKSKTEVMKYIENAGFFYGCESKYECFIYRNNLKVRVFPDYVYIEYTDKTFKKIWDVNLATNIIYS
jgi:hypothetical protein